MVAQNNFRVFLSSDQQQACSLKQMKAEISKQASKVGEKGILIVFLSGHGVKLSYNYGPDKWGFAPADYNKTAEAVLTGQDITRSIQEAKCKSKYTLIILDCCYSGLIAIKLLEDDKTCSLLHVLAGGKTSIVVKSLGYTIFAYFLQYAMDKVKPPAPFILPLPEVFKECKLCAEALFSIIIRCDVNILLEADIPIVITENSFDLQDPVRLIQTCDATFHEKTAFVWKFMRHLQPLVLMLHRVSIERLDSLTASLQILEERNFLEAESHMLLVVISLLVSSIALIELKLKNVDLTNPNLFLLVFLVVMTTLHNVNHNIKVTPHHLMEAAYYYRQVCGILSCTPKELAALEELYFKIKKDLSLATEMLPPLNYIGEKYNVYSNSPQHFLSLPPLVISSTMWFYDPVCIA